MLLRPGILSIICIALNSIFYMLVITSGSPGIPIFVFIQILIAFAVFLVYYLPSAKNRISEIIDDLTNSNLLKAKQKESGGVLEGKLNEFIYSLRKTISEVYGVSRIAGSTGIYLLEDIDNISKASANISTTLNEMANGNSEIAGSVAKASGNSAEIYRSVTGIKDQIALISMNSQNTTQMVAEGNDALRVLGKTLYESIESFGQVGSVINNLKKVASEINSIVDTISGIASQTNLLALNAAIEAARAGDAGKGFSVVASEVRKLAEESDKSAARVRTLIEKVDFEVDRSIEAINNNKLVVAEQETHLKDTEKAFSNIDAAMKVVEEEIKDIFTGINKLNAYSETLTSQMESISAVCQESAASSEELNASMQENADSFSSISEKFNEFAQKTETISTQLEKYSFIKIAYNEYGESIFQMEVLKELIRRKLGLAAEGVLVNSQEAWRIIAEGKADVTAVPWMPISDASLDKRYGSMLDNLGPNLTGCKSGLVVPSYVTIDSIQEMKNCANKFNNKICSLQRRTIVAQHAAEAIKEYDLNGYSMEYNDEEVMLAALDKAIKGKEWIVVTGWQPHYKFGVYELKFLNDPKGTFGKEEYCTTLIRKRLKEENAELYQIFKDFKLSMDIVNNALCEAYQGTKIEDAAIKYVDSLKNM